MSDGDPYNRRSNRPPNDQGQPPSWEDEQGYGDPYGAPPPAQSTRRPAPRSGSSQQPAEGYGDPNRNPQQPSRREPDPYGSSQGGYDWPESGGAQWPDRPYADPRSTGQQPGNPAQQPQPQRRPSGDYDYGDEEIDDWEKEQYRKGRSRPSMPKISAPRLKMPDSVGAAVAGQDSRLLIIAAGALLSLAAMAAVTANRVSSMDGWFPLHIDASGAADWWGSPSTLWRLPLGLAMLTVMNVVASLIVGARDRHVAWVLIGALPLIHLIGWIALIMIGW